MKNLSKKELKQVNGGAWWIPALMLLGAMINDAQNNPDEFEEAFNKVYSH